MLFVSGNAHYLGCCGFLASNHDSEIELDRQSDLFLEAEGRRIGRGLNAGLLILALAVFPGGRLPVPKRIVVGGDVVHRAGQADLDAVHFVHDDGEIVFASASDLDFREDCVGPCSGASGRMAWEFASLKFGELDLLIDHHLDHGLVGFFFNGCWVGFAFQYRLYGRVNACADERGV